MNESDTTNGDAQSTDGTEHAAPEELESTGTVEHTKPNGETKIYAVFECPEPGCDAIVTEWCQCPKCLWYDGDVWQRTMSGPLEVKS